MKNREQLVAYTNKEHGVLAVRNIQLQTDQRLKMYKINTSILTPIYNSTYEFIVAHN